MIIFGFGKKKIKDYGAVAQMRCVRCSNQVSFHLLTLKELLGHSKIETTEGYVTPSMAEMKAAVEGLAQTTARVLPSATARA